VKIVLGTHAFIRTGQRDVSHKQVIACIEEPELTWTQRQGHICVSKHFNGRRLKVVYKQTTKLIIVITVYWVE
jgi:hypothetical protein